jgi:hypothetical protein
MTSGQSLSWRSPFRRLVNEANSVQKLLSSHIYPDWIRSRQLTPGEIPVFYYHKLSARRFERELHYLKRNSYATLTADEYYECITQRKRYGQRLVMLTFDDGLVGVFQTIFPLLKRFNMKAVAYIVPDWIGKPGMLSWGQVSAMHETGLVDIQSHSMSHKAIYIKPHIEDFFPGVFYTEIKYLHPLSLMDSGIPDFFEGMPIYTATSRLSDHPRFFPDGQAERFCRASVQRHRTQGRGWSRRWKSSLLREISRARLQDSDMGRYESAEEQMAALRAEIDDSRSAIENVLIGKQVKHFAYPWHIGGLLSAEVLRTAGFSTCAGGLSDPPGVRAMMPQLLPVRRVNLDFLRCLPGTGRSSSTRIWATKIARRLVRSNGGTSY